MGRTRNSHHASRNKPHPGLPQGEGATPTPSNTARRSSRPLGRAWGGAASGTPAPWEGTEKQKPTIKLKVDDGEIAVLPFIICLF